VDGHAAVQQLAGGGGQVVHGSAAQEEIGQPVVRPLRLLDVGDVCPDRGVGLLQLGEGGSGVVHDPGRVDGDGGVRPHRAQQGHLVARELPRGAVGREQDADHLATGAGARPQQERHAQDRDQALVADSCVDRPAVLEALVATVVGARVGAAALRDQTAETGAQRHAERLEQR
jgi:hypothetical protein